MKTEKTVEVAVCDFCHKEAVGACKLCGKDLCRYDLISVNLNSKRWILGTLSNPWKTCHYHVALCNSCLEAVLENLRLHFPKLNTEGGG